MKDIIQLNNEATHCFAVPGELNIVDMISPETGRSMICNNNLAEMRERYPTVVKIKFDEWLVNRTAELNGPVVWDEITEEKYFDYLGCVPPICFDGEDFMVGEAEDHFGPNSAVRYRGVIVKEDKYFASSRAMTVKEFKAR